MDRIAFLIHSFYNFVSRTEIVRFVQRYGFKTRKELKEVWNRFRKIRHRHFRERMKLCFRESREYGVRKGILYRKGIDLDSILLWVKQGAKILEKGEPHRAEHRWDTGLFVKRTSHSLERWKNTHGLRIRGIDTPQLFACSHRWVVGEWLDAPDLPTWIKTRYGALKRQERDEFLRALARAVRTLHQRGVYHFDLKATNVLVQGYRFFFIGLDRIRFSLAVSDRDRISNLAQLLASLANPISRMDRLRFFHYYGGPQEWIPKIIRMAMARES
jgi:tRNA A-37 threonylcarbamoyl transferase component Bud32